MRRWLRTNQSLIERAVDDRLLDLFDRDRIIVDGQHACRFARRGTETARELREVVGGMEPFDGGLPVVAIHEVVPLRDEIAERTTAVAERDAAVHAPRSLLAQDLYRQREIHLAVVGDAFRHRAFVRGMTGVLEETGACPHQLTSSSCARSARRYSSGITLTKRSRSCGHARNRRFATALPVSAT